MEKQERKHLSLDKDKTESLKKSLLSLGSAGKTPRKIRGAGVSSKGPLGGQNFTGPRRNPPKQNTEYNKVQANKQEIKKTDTDTPSAENQAQPEAAKGTGPQKKQVTTKGPKKVVVELGGAISVGDLAQSMNYRAPVLVKALMDMGVMATVTQTLDLETAQLLVQELGHDYRLVTVEEKELGLTKDDKEPGELKARNPVVVIMGHVDHGKTTLLDALSGSRVAEREQGGITQNLRATEVMYKDTKIVFLDTPGHESFNRMRFECPKLADIVLLIVAGNDSVKPQTVESITFAQESKSPVVVAITKSDVDGFNPDKTLQDLIAHEIIPESLGGDVMHAQVGAKNKEGIEGLLDTLLLQSEVLDLKTSHDSRAEGLVLDAQMKKGRGAYVTVLVKQGILKQGDIVVAGSTWGKVRGIITMADKQVKEVGPVTAVNLLGLNQLPNMGEKFIVMGSEAKARALVDLRVEREKKELLARKKGKAAIGLIGQEDNKKNIYIVLKGAVKASLSSVVCSLESIGNDELSVEVIQSSIGDIGEADIDLARAGGAMVLGFGAGVDPKASSKAKMDGVEIICGSVIYRLIEEIEKVALKSLGEERKETYLGKGKVIQVFDIGKVGKVAGCLIEDGSAQVGAHARITRGEDVIFEGAIKNIKVKEDKVESANMGTECGILMDGCKDLELGDLVEIFKVEYVQKTLS